MSKPIIVCVPGSFHSPSSWDAVANLLRKQGYQVLTPPLATCTTTEAAKDIVGKTTLDDAAIVHEHLVPFLDQGAEAVVVSHSYGSVSATIAVEGQTVEERKAKGLKGGIKSLVVIAGFAFPVHGKSVMGDDNDPPVPEWYILRVSFPALLRKTYLIGGFVIGWSLPFTRFCQGILLQRLVA